MQIIVAAIYLNKNKFITLLLIFKIVQNILLN